MATLQEFVLASGVTGLFVPLQDEWTTEQQAALDLLTERRAECKRAANGGREPETDEAAAPGFERPAAASWPGPRDELFWWCAQQGAPDPDEARRFLIRWATDLRRMLKQYAAKEPESVFKSFHGLSMEAAVHMLVRHFVTENPVNEGRDLLGEVHGAIVSQQQDY